MVQEARHELNLYKEAKAGLSSLIQQTITVLLGFVVMLLITGGAPSGFVIALSFCLGTAFVSWSEQKRVRSLKTVGSSITPKKSETGSSKTIEEITKRRSHAEITKRRSYRKSRVEVVATMLSLSSKRNPRTVIVATILSSSKRSYLLHLKAIDSMDGWKVRRARLRPSRKNDG